MIFRYEEPKIEPLSKPTGRQAKHVKKLGIQYKELAEKLQNLDKAYLDLKVT